MKMSLIILLFFGMGATTDVKKSFHDFTVTDINGKEYKLSSLKGKKVMVVNVASKCGLTPQYKTLESMYQTYKDQGFTIVGFPANNFGSQEPGTNDEIEQFCQVNYGVSFPMMSKVSVKGSDQCELYKWLTSKKENGVTSSMMKWNFQKFLINEDGTLHEVLLPTTSPDAQKVIKWITNG